MIEQKNHVAPSRARGLKLLFLIMTLIVSICRAFTGAWIETSENGASQKNISVAPSRARGLKTITR